MVMSRDKAARFGKVTLPAPGPLRRLCGEAKSPFIVHGHRLASLYRSDRKAPIRFIVLKICKNLRLLRVMALAYLQNNEAGAVA